MRPVPHRYNTDGPWFKGNTHIHTTRSDGGKDPETVADLYAGRGYHFIFITDHNRPSDIENSTGLPLLALNGVEIDGRDETGAWFHAVALGHDGELLRGEPIGVQTAFLRQRGALVILAHPYWSGNSAEDALRHEFDGVEVYNHICHYLNGKSHSAYHWDRMLKRNPRTLGFAADDAHMNGTEPWDGAHIVLAAPSLTRDNVLNSLRAGNFYSTLGPRFESIHARASHIYVRTSPVAAIRLVDDTPWGRRVLSPNGKPITEAHFDVEEEHTYLRVECEDSHGRRAWTNAILER
jgi:hypothetical protein